MIQKITPDFKLVVAKMLPDGRIDHTAIQPLEQWQRGPRNIELMRHGYGHELLDILTSELGLVSVDDNGLLHSRVFIVNDEENVRGAVMRLLGKIAEALIVRSCHSDIYANRRWGQIGRRGAFPHHSLDHYVAVGTGLETTRRSYHQKYRPNDPQRDVIWVHRSGMKRELQTLANSKPAGYSAGLQMKVSMNGFAYIYRSDIRSAKYEVPLVYFDLRNDFYELANAVHKEGLGVTLGIDLVRGKDVDPVIHDRLCSYWYLADLLVRGQLSIDQLINDDLLFDAFKKTRFEDSGSQIITI